MTAYTEPQILKYALNYYIKRPETTVKNAKHGLQLLNKIEAKVENLNDVYGIQ
ncbi:hypothetical protein [Sporolactobacillus pectinivorans]|uniref:hypothetical protein n=1 Tax=Sporolactobacillus pectinivorans TaxID=1591408 RepID=UPI0012FD0A59|nr:hypothetical protein [Sporolactobacillus pectinivorans]